MPKEKSVEITTPVYQQIALDLASKICDQRYRVGDKLYARSALASQYNVSPETARRAICILADLGIVKASRGSGVVVTSYEKAVDFIRHYRDVHTIEQLRQDILGSAQRQLTEIEYLHSCIKTLLDKTDRFRDINPFVPYKLEIDAGSLCIGKSISDMRFWQRTGATIVAVQRKGALMLSPGPYLALQRGDVLFFIGEETCQDRVYNLLYTHGGEAPLPALVRSAPAKD